MTKNEISMDLCLIFLQCIYNDDYEIKKKSVVLVASLLNCRFYIKIDFICLHLF